MLSCRTVSRTSSRSLEEQPVSKLRSMVRAFCEDSRGATMVEYALMLALIAVICLASVGAVGAGASATFTTVAGGL
jgi:pilus assembly protein Flp/PilA